MLTKMFNMPSAWEAMGEMFGEVEGSERLINRMKAATKRIFDNFRKKFGGEIPGGKLTTFRDHLDTLLTKTFEGYTSVNEAAEENAPKKKTKAEKKAKAETKAEPEVVEEIDLDEELDEDFDEEFDDGLTDEERGAVDLASDYLEGEIKNTADGGRMYSFAGTNAEIANIASLETAQKMLDAGTDDEAVRKETGWFKGYDGKWRFELSDRDMEVDTRGKFHSNPDIRRYTELVDKVYFQGTASEAEIQDLRSLEEKLKGVRVEPKTLGELIKHDNLFAAYPQLKDLEVYFSDIDANGAYSPVFKEIVLQKRLKLDKNKLSKTLIHEIQHAIQDIEGYAAGSNDEYWRRMGIPDSELGEYYKKTAGEIEARDSADRTKLSDEERKNTRPDIDREDVVFAENDVVYFSANEKSDDDSIKTQIKNNSAKLLESKSVADVNYRSMSKKDLHGKISEVFKKLGYKVERENFGVINIGEKQIAKSLNYIGTDAEKAAMFAIPNVLKRGEIISGHNDHKGRKYDTITIGAKININGSPAIVGAVVTEIDGKNKYRVHRVILPNNSVLVFNTNEKNTEPTFDKLSSSDKRVSIGSVFDQSLSQGKNNVNSFDNKSFSSPDTDVLPGVESPSVSEDISVLESAKELDGRMYSSEDTDVGLPTKYTYEYFASKPDMEITQLDGTIPSSRQDAIRRGKQNAADVGTVSENGTIAVLNKDTGNSIVVNTDGLKHGLQRGNNYEEPNYIVTLKAGEILKNAIRVNELNPKKENARKAYVLIGTAENTNGEMYVVRFVINSFDNELVSMDVLYAVNAKKESATLNAPRSTTKSLSVTDSKISVADLLSLVNTHFPEILPADVLRHFGRDARPEGVLAPDILYSAGDTDVNTPETPLATVNDFNAEVNRIYREGKAAGKTDEEIGKEVEEVARSRNDAAGARFGFIEPGENPVRDVHVPKQTSKDDKVSLTVRTAEEAGSTTEETLPSIDSMIANGTF
ncbi:MAG: hypothetical protein E7619_10115 [Ruminococcaceae bacterium]|nr:hypothetical protein [Oscillospiraceae bacterium]